MYYRYAPTTNLGLSPFEIIYGRSMIQNLDWDLVANEPSVLGPQQYAHEIRQKLAVLHQIALPNARDSAQRHRDRVNENATIPTYKVADKVLLSNPAIRVGDSAKLTTPFPGPFLVKEIRPSYDYILTDLTAGKTLPRCVPAERLRVFRERDKEARTDETEICLFEGKTKHRLITVKMLAADTTSCTADVLVNPTDSQLTPCNDVAKAIVRLAGEEFTQQCVERLTMHGPLEVAVPLFTGAGRLSSHVKKILHVVTPDTTKLPYATHALLAETTLTTAYYNCLIEADKHQDIQSIAQPILDVSASHFDMWTAAHAAAKDVVSFDENSAAAPGALQNNVYQVNIVCFGCFECCISTSITGWRAGNATADPRCGYC
jgi:O-acetyl-ADP-ribose deacetylase (regulator of RNase III)